MKAIEEAICASSVLRAGERARWWSDAPFRSDLRTGEAGYAMKHGESEVYAQLADLEGILADTVCVLGIGNRLRGDDGAGSIFAEMLGAVSDISCIDGGVAPENYLEMVIRMQPDTVLIVDATDFKGIPGEVQLFHPNGITSAGISTHALSLSLACEYLADRSSAKIYLLGIQPESNRLGDELSETVRSTLIELADYLGRAGIIE